MRQVLTPGVDEKNNAHKVRDRKEIFIGGLSAVPGLEITNRKIEDTEN